MEFTVPQFTEYESKVFGPFTFKQFIVVGAAGIICFALYYKTPPFIYIPGWAIVGGGALAFAFLKIKGRSPVVMVKNFLLFSAAPKVYVWKRKTIIPKMAVQQKEEMKKEKKESKLKIMRRSRLSNLATRIETEK